MIVTSMDFLRIRLQQGVSACPREPHMLCGPTTGTGPEVYHIFGDRPTAGVDVTNAGHPAIPLIGNAPDLTFGQDVTAAGLAGLWDRGGADRPYFDGAQPPSTGAGSSGLSGSGSGSRSSRIVLGS